MNSFKTRYACYLKAKKQSSAVLQVLCLLVGGAVCIPIFYYGIAYKSDSLFWRVIVKIVCLAVGVGVYSFVGGLVHVVGEPKILRFFFKKQLDNYLNNSSL